MRGQHSADSGLSSSCSSHLRGEKQDQIKQLLVTMNMISRNSLLKLRYPPLCIHLSMHGQWTLKKHTVLKYWCKQFIWCNSEFSNSPWLKKPKDKIFAIYSLNSWFIFTCVSRNTICDIGTNLLIACVLNIEAPTMHPYTIAGWTIAYFYGVCFERKVKHFKIGHSGIVSMVSLGARVKKLDFRYTVLK